jgi:hypothetical protein
VGAGNRWPSRCGEISSWIAARGFARPHKAALGGAVPFAGPSFDIGEEERTFIVISASRRRKEPKASAEKFWEASTTQKSPPLTH